MADRSHAEEAEVNMTLPSITGQKAEASQSIKSGQSNGTVEITPSGIPVYYQSRPKRLYRIGPTNPLDTDRLIVIGLSESDKLGYLTDDWREVPSVTTALDVLDKSGPLVWWAQGIAADGVLELQRQEAIDWSADPATVLINTETDPLEPPIWEWFEATKDTLVKALTQRHLSTNHVRDKAGDRGQAVHDAFEAWAKTGNLPDPDIYPETEQGYVRGLCEFITAVDPEPLAAEVLVASVEHGYAGRYDIRLRIPKPCDVVVHRTPKRGPQYRRLSPGLILADLKTSKSAYPTHALQLIAYEGASVESGYEPSDARGILHVTADGHYAFKRAKAKLDDFLAVLDVWRRFQSAKEWL